MPLPKGFDSQAIFAEDDNHPAGPDPWSGQPNKLALTGYAQGIEPGETVPAEVLNYELWRLSQLALALAPAEALNFSHGEHPGRSNLDSILMGCVVWVPEEKIWIGCGTSAATKRIVASYNGVFWNDESPGGFPGVLNLGTAGGFVFIFVANGDFYTRGPDGLLGDMSAVIAPSDVAAWAGSALTGADNCSSVMTDPDTSAVWIGFRTVANVPSIARITPVSYATVDEAETAGLDAFTWLTNEYVSFSHQAGKRIVCFVATNAFAVQHNVFRWSTSGPTYTTGWVGSVTNTIRIVATFGKVVGLGKAPGDLVLALTSSGRAYQSADLQTWARVDNASLDDEERQFFSCVQVGAITYARGTWARPSTGGNQIEGIFHSLDYGATWHFEASPLRAFDPDALLDGQRLRGHGDRISYSACNTAADATEIAIGMLTGPTRRQ